MKIKIKESIETEKEIKLPFYFKWRESAFYCIKSETEAISVFLRGVSISKTSASVIAAQYGCDDFNKECSAEEFITAFDKAVESLQQLVKTNIL